jgi:hypothetical protein
MKTYNEMKLDNLTEDELINEISIGKIGSTVILGRLTQLTRKMKDRQLGEVFKWIGFLIYNVSLQQKSKKENSQQIKDKQQKSIVWKHLR